MLAASASASNRRLKNINNRRLELVLAQTMGGTYTYSSYNYFLSSHHFLEFVIFFLLLALVMVLVYCVLFYYDSYAYSSISPFFLTYGRLQNSFPSLLNLEYHL